LTLTDVCYVLKKLNILLFFYSPNPSQPLLITPLNLPQPLPTSPNGEEIEEQIVIIKPFF
jgi:hypothetical protein